MYHIINSFGRYIEELREEKGVAIEELASQLGVTPKTIKRWIGRQYRDCSLDRICEILRILGN